MAPHRCQTTAIPERTEEAHADSAPLQVMVAAKTPDLVRVDNVTTEAGKRAGHGPSTSWLTRDGEYIVEHVAAIGPSGNLLIYYWSTRRNSWRVVDASAEASQRIGNGPLTSWVTRDGDDTVEHVAAIGPGGELLVFYWSPRHGTWRVVNATREAGPRIAAGPSTSWLTRDGEFTVEHVAAVDALGNLQVFYWSPRRGRWRAVNASSEAGLKVVPNPTTSWITRDGDYTVEHVAARSHSRELLVFYWSPRHGRWRVVNASGEAHQLIAVGPATNWITRDGEYLVEHVAAISLAGNLLVFYWSPRHGVWRVVNATREAGGSPLASATDAFQDRVGADNHEIVFARSRENHLVAYWWQPSLAWQALDLTDATGASIVSDPVAWKGSASRERIAARDGNGNVLAFSGSGLERSITDAVRRPYESLKRTRNIRRKVITILWDPHKPNVPQPDRAAVEAAVFGRSGSVRAYFLENSSNLFTIENAGILGWYDSNYKPGEYWPGGGKAGRDSGAEAIRKAARQFAFETFDTNDDNSVSTPELAVLFILPGTSDGGGLNRIVGEDYTTRDTAKGITVDGVKITWIAEVSIGQPPGPGIVAHELSHLLLGHGDMYFTFFTHTAAGAFSLMDQDGPAPHLDPFAKLKLGWLRPTVLFRSGRYRLPNVEGHSTAWILLDPRRGTNEYFMVENRWPGTSFDQVLPDRGLAVWHVMEDKDTYNAAFTPANVDAAKWKDLSGWARKGIRMVRPIQVPPFNNQKALWDGAEADTGYDLLSADPDPRHATLRWGDGTPSGFALRDISPAGAEMQVSVTVPRF